MSFVLTLLTSFGTSVLKIFLSGLFNTVITKIQDDAANAVTAAQLQAQTTNEAAALAVQVAHDQAAVTAGEKTPGDPFNTGGWNQK